MLHPDGAALSVHHANSASPVTVTEVIPGIVFHVAGLGSSNASVLIGDASVILVDAPDTDAQGVRLRAMIAEWTSKPVTAIISTHGQPDHDLRDGAGAFADTVEEVIANTPATPPLPRMDALANVRKAREARQGEATLRVGDGTRASLPPPTCYAEPIVERTIDGIRLTLHAVPGETGGQIVVWAEDLRVLCCGDLYPGSLPDLGAIRGGPYRDVATWISSLDRVGAYPAVALLPRQAMPILGEALVQDALAAYRDALDHVLTATLAYMDRGMTVAETVEAVTLSERFADSPYLAESGGTVAWMVRSIYTGYLGWFDGNPTNLHPLPHRERAANLVGLAGGRLVVRTGIRIALNDEQWQWAAELADLLLALDPADRTIRAMKAQALRALAQQETNADGRRSYLAAADELVSSDLEG